MQISDQQTILFIGDSITDCGRERPLGSSEMNADSLGAGYVRQFHTLLAAHYPERTVRVFNTGIGGNRVTDLESRWEEDVLAHKPDWVSIMIGINDVWRHWDRPFLKQVSLEEYSQKLEALIKKTAPEVHGMRILSPYFLDINRQDPMRAMMDQYGQAARKVAEKTKVTFIDVQAKFDQWLAHQPTQRLCSDRVHPNPTGHGIIAAAALNSFGFEWQV